MLPVTACQKVGSEIVVADAMRNQKHATSPLAVQTRLDVLVEALDHVGERLRLIGIVSIVRIVDYDNVTAAAGDVGMNRRREYFAAGRGDKMCSTAVTLLNPCGERGAIPLGAHYRANSTGMRFG